MKKPVIGVVFGSRSVEHDISIVTAIESVIKPLELSKKFEIVPIYIAKNGMWYSDPALKDIKLFVSGKIDTWLKKNDPVSLRIGNGLQLIQPGFRTHAIKINVVFPALHGTHGEDGDVMGLCELAGMPYVGCGVAASAVAMDKVLTKQLAQAIGIAVAPYQSCTKHEYEADSAAWITTINRSLRYPMFVKPAHLGSSIGNALVTDPNDLVAAIEYALRYDDRVLVEEAVPNILEVTLPIIGNTEPRPALLEQAQLKTGGFLDFEAKYFLGGKRYEDKDANEGSPVIPADVTRELYDKVEATGLAMYKALGCSGIACVEMFIDSQSDTVYCNEVNPMPSNLYAHNWNRAGLSKVELVTTLVELAVERYNQRAALGTTFATNYLQQF